MRKHIQKEKLIKWILCSLIAIWVLILVAWTIGIKVNDYHATQLTTQGIPDLRDTTNLEYHIACLIGSSICLICLMKLKISGK